MRYVPSDKYDREETERLGAQPWQIDLLKLNPDYVSWGPHEDYMIRDGGGWDSRQMFASWKAFGPWSLDDLNEVVNFYFEISRESENCKTCGGNGYHPDGQWVSESFYRHSSPFTQPDAREYAAKAVMARFSEPGAEIHGRGGYPSPETLAKYGDAFREFCEAMRNGEGFWHKDITPDEAQALLDAGRTGWDGPMGHDAINRGILVERRCKRLGLPTTCPSCNGHGSTFTADEAHVNLVLWFLHPRKGCSRGVEVRITQGDIPTALDFLREAAERNADRFKAVISCPIHYSSQEKKP